MKRVACLVVVAAIAAGLGVVAPPVRAAPDHHVRVEDNAFVPRLLQIQPGDTVVWTATRSQHSIRADDGRFDFPSGRPGLDIGEQVSWTFTAEEEVPYYCRIHGFPGGGGMSGLIRVGDPPRPPIPDRPTIVVPDDVTSLRDAVAGAQPGARVLVRPGTYHEEVVASVRDVEIRGVGPGPTDVVVDGGHVRAAGIVVAAPGVRVSNLSVVNGRTSGIRVDGAAGAVVTDAELTGNGLFGIEAHDPSGLAIRRVRIARHGGAGIRIGHCKACGVLVDEVSVQENAAGVAAEDATGLVLRRSEVSGNGAGIVLWNVTGALVTGNVISDNDATDVWITGGLSGGLSGAEQRNGAGVWISGGRSNRVLSNTATGHTYNIALTGPAPIAGHVVEANTVGRATAADLGVDAAGHQVCFAGNLAAAGGEATSHPTGVQTLYDCALPATAVVPFPVVTATLAAHAAR